MNINFWKEKHILITGTASGIGAALVDQLKEIPCTIFAVDRVENRYGSDSPAKIIPIRCDISRDEDVKRLQRKILAETEIVDVLFNNAGITTHGRFDETEMDVFRKTFEINFFGGVHLIRLLIEPIKKAKGAIISTSTVSSLYGIPGRAAYSSSKSALNAVMETIRIELSEHGVRSIIFCPPYTKTALRTSGFDAKGKRLNEAQYAGKILTPEQVANEMINAVENPRSRLVTFDKSGKFVKWMRLFAPALLEKIIFKKLYKDFH